MIGFIIVVNAPGDPALRLLNINNIEQEKRSSFTHQDQELEKIRVQLGLNLPLFYFSLQSLSDFRNIREISDKNEQKMLSSLADAYGNPNKIYVYYKDLKQLEKNLQNSFAPSHHPEEFHAWEITRQLLINSKEINISSLLINLEKSISLIPNNVLLVGNIEKVKEDAHQINLTKQVWKKYIPVIRFYPQNQYHRWLFGDGNMFTGKNSTYSKGIIRGDFGLSYDTHEPVLHIILPKLAWSLFFNIISIIIATVISIFLAKYMVLLADTWSGKILSVFIFLLYAIPGFVFGVSLLLLFSNPEMLQWLPSSGIKPLTGYPPDSGFFSRFLLTLPYLVLPLITYTYSSIAYFSGILKNNLSEIMKTDYIRTARAKGLTKKQALEKHALRNALFPLITIVPQVLPYSIGGAVIIETIFTIPGMGLAMYQAVLSENIPIITAAFTLGAFLTLTAFLISDILYAMVDPRVRFSNASPIYKKDL